MKSNLGLWMGLMFTALSGLLLWGSLALPYYTALGPGPGLFPRWLSVIFLALSVLYTVDAVRGRKIVWSDVMPKGRELWNVIAVVGSAAATLPLLSQIGFIATGTLVLFFLLNRSYPWRRSLLIGLAASLFIDVAFADWLDVPLPTGEIWEWMS